MNIYGQREERLSEPLSSLFSRYALRLYCSNLYSSCNISLSVNYSEKHHKYLKKLGASRTFDCTSDDFVEQIIKSVKDDAAIDIGYVAIGDLGKAN